MCVCVRERERERDVKKGRYNYKSVVRSLEWVSWGWLVKLLGPI